MQLIEGRSLAEIIAEMKPGRPPSHDETAPAAALINHATAADTAKAVLPTVRATGALLYNFPPSDTREYYRTIARLGIQAAEALDQAPPKRHPPSRHQARQLDARRRRQTLDYRLRPRPALSRTPA